MDGSKFVPGVYKHFKGGLYDALYTAHDSEVPEREFVVYRSKTTGDTWVRPLANFVEHIERDGYAGPRFSLIEEKTI